MSPTSRDIFRQFLGQRMSAIADRHFIAVASAAAAALTGTELNHDHSARQSFAFTKKRRTGAGKTAIPEILRCNGDNKVISRAST
jgi:hypothetical protein